MLFSYLYGVDSCLTIEEIEILPGRHVSGRGWQVVRTSDDY